MGSRLRFVVALGAATLTLASAQRARADGEGAAAVSEQLFQDARKLMEAHKYAEACPKFLASENASAALGTLLNLADCYEKNGQLASAWVRFREAIGMAQQKGRADREKTARERADSIYPRLLRLKVVVQEQGVDVKLDGTSVTGALDNIPVDPGKHTLEASAKGKKTYTTTASIAEADKAKTVQIPALEDTPPDTPPVAPPPVTPPTNPTSPPEEDTNRGGTQRILGIVGMGLGGAGLVVGSVFGLLTQSRWNASRPHCTSAGICDQTGVDLATQAASFGNISTVAFIAGGVLAAGGAVVFFTAPSGGSSAPAPGVPPASTPGSGDGAARVELGIGVASVLVRGTF